MDSATPPAAGSVPKAQLQDIVEAVIKSRTAVRAFAPTPVPEGTLREILEIARHAPSNSNTQPWFVHLLHGEPKRRFSQAVTRSHEEDALPPSAHFPDDLPAPCKDRQADFGTRYYKVLGIDRDDLESRYRQTARNFCFFDAPVGLIFSIDKRLTKHSWLDFGLFLQTLMLVAKSRGLDTCPQAAFAQYPVTIRRLLGLPADEVVVCGMAIGYADQDAPENALRTSRVPAREFATFAGFSD